MLRTLSLLLALLYLISSTALAQLRSGGRPGTAMSTSSLEVRVFFLNGGQPSTQFRVELLNSGGVPIRTGFTDSSGRAQFSGLNPGMFTLHVTSPETEDASSNFEISTYERVHNEDVQVKLRTPEKSAGTPQQGTVSAQALNIPEKALKEFNKGNEAAQRKDFDAAKEHYRKALESDPKFVAAGNNLGSICLQLKDYACARDALERAVEADGHSARALANLARLRMMEQHYSEAEALFGRSLAVDPVNPGTLMLMAETELALRKFPDALLYARKVPADKSPDFAVVHIVAGRALEAENKSSEAVLEYQAFLKQAPQHPAAPEVEQALARLNRAPTATADR
jgi:tetratricopeptide (TPR) repeat protein